MSLYQVARDGQTLGEFNESQIREGLQTGYFQPADWCWREGMGEWQGLSSMFQQPVNPVAQPLPRPTVAPVINPYAAPPSSLAGRTSRPAPRALVERASPGTRLGALILDYLAMVFCLVPAILMDSMKIQGSNELQNVIVCGLFIVLCIANLILIATEGQSVGKKILGIRIAEMDTSTKAGFFRIVFLRTLIGRGLLAFVPLYGLVDALFIFNEDRRCLHDKIGGTHVIKV